MTVIMRISHGSRGDRHGQGPMIIRDGLDDMVSPIDGKPQTSKRAYYRQLREAGCEINDRAAAMKDVNRPEYDTAGLKETIARAIHNPRPEEPQAPIPELDL